MQKRTRGRPAHLDTILHARHTMQQLIDRFDALLYNTNDRGRTERGLDPLMLETISTLQRLYTLRNGLDAGIP
jgi:hypothetical protein